MAHVAPQTLEIRDLLAAHWYDAVAVLLEHRAGGAQARRLANVARRVLDLDAADFSVVAAAFDRPWARRLAEASFPAGPNDHDRGAFGSLVPLYELMLEVVEVRAVRREAVQVVVTAHLIAEYLQQLAWERILGHGGDPLQLSEMVAGSRWGTDDRACPHTPTLRSAAKRVLHACAGDNTAFITYLDRYHSRQGDALGICALNLATVGVGERPDVGYTCPNPCGFVTDLPQGVREDLDARVRLALIFLNSPIVVLRHHAPVGHFFGVPSVAEISAAWLRTWERVSAAWPDGANPLQTGVHPPATDKREALPGLSALVSAVAGRPVGAGTVLRDISADIVIALDEGA